jgi:hypothetical protein
MLSIETLTKPEVQFEPAVVTGSVVEILGFYMFMVK